MSIRRQREFRENESETEAAAVNNGVQREHSLIAPNKNVDVCR